MNGDEVLKVTEHFDKKIDPIYTKLDEMDKRFTKKNGEQDIALERHDGKIWLLWRILMWIIGPTGIIGLVFLIFKDKLFKGG